MTEVRCRSVARQTNLSQLSCPVSDVPGGIGLIPGAVGHDSLYGWQPTRKGPRARQPNLSAMGHTLALLTALLITSPATSHAADLSVDARRGDDANPGTAARPFRTIAKAAGVARAGDTVRIATGVYREAVSLPQSGTAAKPIRFEAALAANVVVTGADQPTEWRREPADAGENVYSTTWPHRFIGWSKTGTHPDDDYHRLIGRAEQVFYNSYPLRQVLSRDKLTRGTFFADLDGRRLYLQADNNARLDGDAAERVEASVRDTVWDVKGDYVRTSGITFRYSAAQAQTGMARLAGRGDVVEDCVFEGSNSEGADFRGPDQVARRCVFSDNGQDGFTAGGAHRLLMTECVIRNNNTKNFDRGWGGGGNKLVLSRGVVIEKSQFLNNRGNGIWFDIGNEECTVRNCLIADNEGAGIFYEISYGLRAHDNVIVGNGFLSNFGAWGADGAISLSSSPNCVIERNLMVGNKEGLQFREQRRTTPRIDGKEGSPEEWIWNHDQTIRNNVIAYNRDAQVWGWFGTDDGRHWPAAMQEPGEKEKGKPEQDIAADYQTRRKDGSPAGLSLEKLKLALGGNLYALQPGQGLFNWGCGFFRHKRYETLDEVRKELNLEAGSVVAGPLPFANVRARDFRLPANSPALKAGRYPRGAVPGVQLGAIPGGSTKGTE